VSKGFYDEENFVDERWVREQLKKVGRRCYHCNVELSWTGNTQFSIDRYDNELGHTKDNCSVICVSCNDSMMSSSSNHAIRKRCNDHSLSPVSSKRRRFNAYNCYGQKQIINVSKKQYPTDEEQRQFMYRTLDARGWSRTKRSVVNPK
jgi:hypothetical protein